MALDPKIRDCGQFLVTFANEKTIHKSINATIPIIKSIFNFGDTFVEKAKKANISIDHDHFNQMEEDTLNLLISQTKILDEIQLLLIILRLNLYKVDAIDKKLFFYDSTSSLNAQMYEGVEIQYRDSLTDKVTKVTRLLSPEGKRIEGGKPINETFEIKVDRVGNFFKSRLLSIRGDSDKENSVSEYFKEKLPKFISKSNDLLNSQKKIDNIFEKFPLIRNKFSRLNNYPTLNSEVEFIKHKNDLIDLIDLIISGAKLFDNRICNRFVCDIEYTLNPKPLLQPNDILKYVPQGINEESFFDNSCGYGVFADDDGNFMSAPPKLSILTPYSNTISYCISKILQHPGYKAHFGKCNSCGKYYFAGTKRQNRKFCSSHCRQKFNNDVRIHSGEHRRYKREKRAAGAKESYYG